jgi:hypothetical protein
MNDAEKAILATISVVATVTAALIIASDSLLVALGVVTAGGVLVWSILKG